MKITEAQERHLDAIGVLVMAVQDQKPPKQVIQEALNNTNKSK